VFTPKTFLTPQHRVPTGGVKSSYAYPDEVHSVYRLAVRALSGAWQPEKKKKTKTAYSDGYDG